MKILRVLAIATAFGVAAQAQTYTESILYNFGVSTTDGRYPYGGLLTETGGYLYGTTTYGGTANAGIVFKLVNGKETILHTFVGGTDGANPNASLVKDKAGNLYGTTQGGGLGLGAGTVFKITSAGKYEILYKFGKTKQDGGAPLGPLTLDSAGNLYGTTLVGGIVNSECEYISCGTVFKLSPKGVETVLYRFAGPPNDGYQPSANVVLDGKGDVFGTTSGLDDGLVWELNSKDAESILFDPNTVGYNAEYLGYSAWDATGNLWVVWIDDSEIYDSLGGLFELSPSGAVSYYALYGPYDGECPPPLITGPLAFIQSNFYGVMSSGGAYATCNPGGTSLPGGGMVYEFNPTFGQQTPLYSFPDPSMGILTDGWGPSGGVVADAAKNLYGTTSGGGLYGYGTVFKLTQN